MTPYRRQYEKLQAPWRGVVDTLATAGPAREQVARRLLRDGPRCAWWFVFEAYRSTGAAPELGGIIRRRALQTIAQHGDRDELLGALGALERRVRYRDVALLRETFARYPADQEVRRACDPMLLSLLHDGEGRPAPALLAVARQRMEEEPDRSWHWLASLVSQGSDAALDMFRAVVRDAPAGPLLANALYVCVQRFPELRVFVVARLDALTEQERGEIDCARPDLDSALAYARRDTAAGATGSTVRWNVYVQTVMQAQTVSEVRALEAPGPWFWGEDRTRESCALRWLQGDAVRAHAGVAVVRALSSLTESGRRALVEALVRCAEDDVEGAEALAMQLAVRGAGRNAPRDGAAYRAQCSAWVEECADALRDDPARALMLLDRLGDAYQSFHDALRVSVLALVFRALDHDDVTLRRGAAELLCAFASLSDEEMTRAQRLHAQEPDEDVRAHLVEALRYARRNARRRAR